MSGISRSGSRISFRPRPIDVTKPLPIVRTEIDDDDSQRMVPLMPTGMESNEEGELHIQEIIQASMKKRTDDLPEIPIPVVKIVDNYDTADNPHPFAMGTTYALYKLLNDDELDQTVEYDMDSEDEAFVGSINQGASATSPPMNGGTATLSASTSASSKRQILSIDRFESIIDKFEKEQYYFGQCDLAKAEQICKGLKPSVVAALHNHWLEKRKGKSTLIRRLLRQPDREDPSPYKAFRAREVEQKQKKARKNDAASLVKMNSLRQEFERARTLLEMIKKREKLKKDYMAVITDLHSKLRELAEIKLTEPVEVELPPPSSTIKHKKHKSADLHKDGSSANIAIDESVSPAVPVPHNYPGPAFINKEQQPLILGNGKARQEGYRHFIVKPGQFPSPTLEKLYGGAASPSLKMDQSLDDTTQQELEEQMKREKLEAQKALELEEAANKYYNSLPTPTSAEYYNDDDEEDEETDDESVATATATAAGGAASIKYNPRTRSGRQRATGGKAAPTTTVNNPYHSASYSTSIQPKMNADGKPIYPSVNQGYIFVSPNLPPILGRARIGRYGGTYIDFVPVDKQTRINFLNHLKHQQQEQEKQKELERKEQLKQHLDLFNNIDYIIDNNYGLNYNNNNDDNNDNNNNNSNNSNNNNNDNNNSYQSSINLLDRVDIEMNDFIEDIDNNNNSNINNNISNNNNISLQNSPISTSTIDNLNTTPTSTTTVDNNKNNQTPPTNFDNDDRSSNKRKLDMINENNDKITKITDFQNLINKQQQQQQQHLNGGSSSSSNGGSGSYHHQNGTTTTLHNNGDSVSSLVNNASPLAQKKLKTTTSPLNSPNGHHHLTPNKQLKKQLSSPPQANHIDQYLVKKTAHTPS